MRAAPVPAGGRARLRGQLHGPDNRHEIERRLDSIAAGRAERGDEEACQSRAGAAGDVKHDGIETDGVGQVAGWYRIGDHGRPGRLMKRLDDSHPEGCRVQVPGLDVAGQDEQGEHGVHHPGQHLGDHYLLLAGVAVGDAARDRGQHEHRDGLDALHQAELDRRVGQLVHEPTAGHLIHPHRHGRGRLPGPEQKELAVAQCRKGPQLQHAPERPPGPPRPPLPGGLGLRRSGRCGVGVWHTPRRLRTEPTGCDGFLAPRVFPQVVSLTHDHPPYTRTPCEGGQTFVDQAPRPFPVAVVQAGSPACGVSPLGGWKTCEYTSNLRLGARDGSQDVSALAEAEWARKTLDFASAQR